MSSTRQITRTVRTRSWHDIDPKIAASAGIAGLVTLVLGTLLIAGRLNANEFAVTVAAVWGVVTAGYTKRSSETSPTIAAIATAADVLDVVAPAVTSALPASADTIHRVEDSVQLIRDLTLARPVATDPAQSPQA